MTETKKRRRRPAGFEKTCWAAFLCVFVDVGDVYGREKIKKRKNKKTAAAFGRCLVG